MRRIIYRPRLTPDALAKLARYRWNQRILTYELFEEFCARENITIISKPLPPLHPGEYKRENGRDVINLDVDLREPHLTLTAWHEVGHYLLHVPGKFGQSQRTETQADFVGYAALVPLSLIESCSDWDIINDHNYPAKFARERRNLRAIFGY